MPWAVLCRAFYVLIYKLFPCIYMIYNLIISSFRMAPLLERLVVTSLYLTLKRCILLSIAEPVFHLYLHT